VFILDAALDEIENHPWQPAPREPSEVVYINRIADFHGHPPKI